MSAVSVSSLAQPAPKIPRRISRSLGEHEVVIVITGLAGPRLINELLSWRNEKKSSPTRFLLVDSDKSKRSFTFFCPFNARVNKAEMVNDGPVPQFDVWVIGNRLIVPRRFYRPDHIAWLRERGMPIEIARPFIRRIHERHKEILSAQPKHDQILKKICPCPAYRKGIFERRILRLHTHSLEKMTKFIRHLACHLSKRALLRRLDELNKKDIAGRALRGLKPRPSPLF